MVPRLSPVPQTPGDAIRPFRIETLPVRGRIVRLDATASEILAKHDYRAPVSVLLAEALALCALLGGALKYDGVFSLELRGEGPVRFLVADMTNEGAMRGYVQYDESALAPIVGAGFSGSLPRLFGPGCLAFTVDQGPDTERYQGLVELEGETLADCAHAYFRHSEQIPTGLKLAAAGSASGWRVAGLMVQWLPGEGGRGERAALGQEPEAWRRVVALMSSARSEEMLDPALSDEALLYRLFHEDGVRVYRPHPVGFACRCSRSRAARILAQLPRQEIAELAVDGRLEVTCQFCNTVEIFDAADFGVSA